MKMIPLTQGKVALVDNRFYRRLMQMKPWCVFKSGETWYAHSRTHGLMHRTIMRLATGSCSRQIDHRNHNGLDNRLTNLRPATAAQNQQNRRPQCSNKSGFKGVHRDKYGRKWVAEIRVEGRPFYLGLFHTKIEAARAYNEAAQKHFGEFAWLNRIGQRRRQRIPVATK